MDYEELTKNDLVGLIDDVDAEIEAVRSVEPEEMVPEHDFYRAVMFGECTVCNYRYVDPDGCGDCRQVKEFLDDYRCKHSERNVDEKTKRCVECGKYFWKSDQKR